MITRELVFGRFHTGLCGLGTTVSELWCSSFKVWKLHDLKQTTSSLPTPTGCLSWVIQTNNIKKEQQPTLGQQWVLPCFSALCVKPVVMETLCQDCYWPVTAVTVVMEVVVPCLGTSENNIMWTLNQTKWKMIQFIKMCRSCCEGWKYQKLYYCNCGVGNAQVKTWSFENQYPK